MFRGLEQKLNYMDLLASTAHELWEASVKYGGIEFTYYCDFLSAREEERIIMLGLSSYEARERRLKVRIMREVLAA